MIILKAAPGLDPQNFLAEVLGPAFTVREYDPSRTLADQGAGADVLLLRDVPVDAATMDALPKLKLLQRLGQHVVGVDFAHAGRKGIPVANVPASVSGGDRMVAEHALYLMMAVAKQAHASAAAVAARTLASVTTLGLTGKTLGMIGVGNTGTELAKMVAGLGMRVIAVKRSADAKLAAELGLYFLGTMDQLDRMLAESDVVSLHLPLGSETKGFLGREHFAAMKRGSIFINIARAPIVQKDALYDALTSGHLAGAGLDVFWEEPASPDDPMLRLPNVVLTPHIAGTTVDVLMNLARAAADNIRRVAAGQRPLNEIVR